MGIPYTLGRVARATAVRALAAKVPSQRSFSHLKGGFPNLYRHAEFNFTNGTGFAPPATV
eukprot:4766180-Prymnesium_polylepis.1